MTPIIFLVFGLATWRIASMLVHEDGPFLFFRRLRESVGIKHDEDGNILIVPERFIPQLLSCVWCSSVWVALAWLDLWLGFPALAEKVAIVCAWSTVAILVETRVRG